MASSPASGSDDEKKRRKKKSSLTHLRIRELLPPEVSKSSRSSPSSPTDEEPGSRGKGRRASTSAVQELMSRTTSAMTRIHTDYVDPSTSNPSIPEIRIQGDEDDDSDDSSVSSAASSKSGQGEPWRLPQPKTTRSHSLTIFETPILQRFQRRKSSVGASSGPSGSTSNLLASVLSRTLGIKKTKSRSVDQSLAAAFDVDVIGGLSRLAGSALGGSTESTGRPGSPVGGNGGALGERRSSGSAGGSTGRLTEENTLAYTVRGSDTLTSLAARFDTTPSELVAINKLSSRLIFPGQVLFVPRKDGDGSLGALGVDDSSSGGPWTDSGLGGGSMNVSIHSASSTSSGQMTSEAGRGADGPGSGYHSPTTERPGELAFLDSLRPPGSPRFNRAGGGGGRDGQMMGDDNLLESQQTFPEDGAPVDIEAERARDRASHEKFLKIPVRHVTDGQGVVAGVLLVTPNTVMFDPNVSDALVMEHGAEAYGVIAPVEFVVNAALYPDIAHMRVGTERPGKSPDEPVISDPIYFPPDCPLHRKYAALKERLEKSKKNATAGAAMVEKEEEEDPAAGILAIAGDIQRRWSEADDRPETPPLLQPPPPPPSSTSGTGSGEPVIHQEETRPEATTGAESEAEGGGAAPPVAGVPVDSEHVIRIQVKATDEEPLVVPDEVKVLTAGSQFRPGHFGEEEETAAEIPRATESVAIPVTGRARTSSTGHQPSSPSPSGGQGSSPSGGASPSQGIHLRQSRHLSGGPQTPPPAAPSSSPESRGHRMLKRLSYPLSWMGESLSGGEQSKEGSPVQQVSDAANPNAESVFSKVFSSGGSGSTRSESWMTSSGELDDSTSVVPEVVRGETSAADGARRLSTENSGLKLDGSRLVPNLFRGSSTGSATTTTTTTTTTAGGGTQQQQQPRLGYRSMVSVDDVPELFASLDKFMPKPAQPDNAPPLYLRLRMGKPLAGSRKGSMTTTPIMSYGKKKMKPEYWFSIPRDKADSLCRFFLLWAPDVYGELGDAEEVARRGFELFTSDLEWEEPSPVRRRPATQLKPQQAHKKALKGGNKSSGKGGAEDGDDDDDPLGVTAELAKESWERAKAPYVRLFTILKTQATLFESDQDEIVSLNEEVRRALYGVERLSALDLESFLPDLLGPTEILTEEYRKALSKFLPARVEGYPWTLAFSTSQHGFSLSSLYRKMAGLDSPVLLVVEDTQGNVFGAIASCEIRASESFYGTGECCLFAMTPKTTVYPWTGENSYFIQGNAESLAFGAGEGRFGLWLDGDLNQGRTQTCKTFGNDPLSPDEDFWVKTLECWAFV